jgi:hypothetical protein
MRKEGQLIALMGTYSAILLIVCILGISILSKKQEAPKPEVIVETAIKTEEVYFYIDADKKAESDANEGEILYIAKEYENKIGIFDTSGRLLRSIDIYTKTLPKADRALLREGIELRSEAELISLIEDYSG